MTVAECITQLMKLHHGKRLEMDHSAFLDRATVRYCHGDQSRMTGVIQQLATPYAADLMLKQLTEAKGLKCEVVEEEDMTVHTKVNRKEGGQHSYDICYNPQNVSCSCEFFITQGLPCRHLFVLDIKRVMG
ncbi:hypothetical protein LSAT2_027297, partial [Lamellibrachia satsuma]